MAKNKVIQSEQDVQDEFGNLLSGNRKPIIKAAGNEVDGRTALYGSDGNDELDGGDGDDFIDGGDGDDVIVDVSGNNILRGGAGNDTIIGVGTMEGGKGDDTLIAANSMSNDTYIFNLGDGKDTIIESAYNGSFSNDDVLKFGAGISASTVRLIRSGKDLTLKISETDQVTIQNWYEKNNSGKIETIAFADGTTWTPESMSKMQNLMFGTDKNDILLGGTEVNRIEGGAGNDKINGGGGDDFIFGGAGNDMLEGALGNDYVDGGDGDDTITDYAGNNTLKGGAGNDLISGNGTLDGGDGNDTLYGGDDNNFLYGGAGNDNVYGGDGDDYLDGGDGDDTLVDTAGNNVLKGGAGNDTLVGAGTMEGGKGNDMLIAGNSTSNDTYIFNAGDGKDTIVETAATSRVSNQDVLKFGEGINSNQLWFKKVGKDLDVTRIGTSEGVVIKDWYVSRNNQVEQFKAADGKTLLSSKVDSLVQAMSAFAPPAAGQTSMPADYQAKLSPMLAANWK